MYNDLKVAYPQSGTSSPDSWSNWNLEMLVFEERGKAEYPEKTFRSKGENQQQTQPTYGVDARISTWATLEGGECSHHCVIPCSSLQYSFNLIDYRQRENKGLKDNHH